MIDEALLDAAVVALQDVGWKGLTLERVANAAGISRVTLWRQGITLEQIIEGLLIRLTNDYRAALWPILTAEGNGWTRLVAALQALCGVAERHLPLLVATDTIFHEAHILTRTHFTEPLARLLEDGMGDGSIRKVDRIEMASVLFNTVCWTYVHMRAKHEWTQERISSLLLDLIMEGLTPHSPIEEKGNQHEQ
ncbi:MAG TPA: TetR/AcrR family transcriptional regulator [Ktedonobacteraceae bacterium]|jgi:AcrR family transcriptional regulator|nr:TetR/AcrR family transcriptional regulator [Ktedonobacteraceae bacterium]